MPFYFKMFVTLKIEVEVGEDTMQDRTRFLYAHNESALDETNQGK